MAYEYNDNRYTTLKRTIARDIFEHEDIIIDSGTDIDSVLAHWIIVEAADNEEFQGLTVEQCLDKKIELGYIELTA